MTYVRKVRTASGAVAVQVARKHRGRVEIIEGLKPGARVVEQGAGFLGEGDKVRVVAAAPAKASAAKPATTPAATAP